METIAIAYMEYAKYRSCQPNMQAFYDAIVDLNFEKRSYLEEVVFIMLHDFEKRIFEAGFSAGCGKLEKIE